MKNPTAKVPSDSRSDVRTFAVGKYSFAMIEANTPYNMKLYHSSPLPITAAMTARGPVTEIVPPTATCCCTATSPYAVTCISPRYASRISGFFRSSAAVPDSTTWPVCST